jgi:hypothetical protein
MLNINPKSFSKINTKWRKSCGWILSRYPSITLSCHRCQSCSEFFFLRSFGVKRYTTVWTIYDKNFSLVNLNEGYLRPKISSKIMILLPIKSNKIEIVLTFAIKNRLLKHIEMIYSCSMSIALSNETNPESNGRSFAEKFGFSRKPRN